MELRGPERPLQPVNGTGGCLRGEDRTVARSCPLQLAVVHGPRNPVRDFWSCGRLRRCRSSVVEHSLGKGEVVSSILTGSTRKTKQIKHFCAGALPFPPALNRERNLFPPLGVGENWGTLFYGCSAPFHCSVSRWSPFSRCLGVKRDLRRVIESIVSATTSAQSSNQTARLAKERTPQAGYRREHVLGGRLNGSHRLEGGGDRVRLSRQLERDAIDFGDVKPWRHTYAKRRPPDGSRGCSEGSERYSPGGGCK